MNILIPHSWLLEHLATDADPQTIQKLVSLSGPSIERIYEREGESVYDIEVTTNRVDSMSVRGIARETAVILAQAGLQAKLLPLAKPQVPEPTQSAVKPLPAISNDPRWCKRIMCVVLTNVQRTPTPEWMAKRLRQIDQNVHDSVIDITNYVTHELGHPCHAFDYDKIMNMGGTIHVLEAVPGKKFTTLDGMQYETKGGEIVFENDEGEIIDLPAIKGTANTAVDDTTTSILLWIESLDAKKVRTASMSHAIRTVAAQLNEKNVDPNLAEPTLYRGIELYQQLCSAQVASQIYDEFVERPQPATVSVSLEKIATYLGLVVPEKMLLTILTALECQARIEGDRLLVTPPTFRPDIQLDVDVIEEVARMYGYHNVPSQLMATAIPTQQQPGTNFILEERAKRLLAASGAQELYTYSMVSEVLALQDGQSLADHLKIANPLSDDRVYLRRSLIPSLQESLVGMQKTELVVFELANVYHPQDGQLPREELHLTILGRTNYRELRAQVEALLADLFISGVTVENFAVGAVKGTLTATGIDGQKIALGEVITTDQGFVAFDLLWSEVLKVASTHPKYQPLPSAAPLIEDITFTLPENTLVGPLVAAMRAVSPLIKNIELTGQYQRNLTFRLTYLDPSAPVSSEQVAPIRRQLVETARQTSGAQLVGSLQ